MTVSSTDSESRMRFTKKESGEVADLICALKAENKRLRKALQFIADEPRGTLECVEIARLALASPDGNSP